MQRTDGLCFGRGEAGYRLLFLNNSFIGFHLDHRFDDKTSESDAKIANMQTDGAISHMQFHRYWFKASAEAAQDSNDYVTKGYFQHNLEGLHDRGLFAPLFLPQDNFSAEDAGSQLKTAPAAECPAASDRGADAQCHCPSHCSLDLAVRTK